MTHPLVLAVRAYRYAIAPMLAPSCRFYPSCSQYAIEAIEAFGGAKGSWLAAKRLCKCHPFHPGGFDPVPEPRASSESRPDTP
jgi:putative membrane protein insertion efficiency factor